jgi:L-ascorbate metabolism protein UlaG (beta-lactamase superfamily)
MSKQPDVHITWLGHAAFKVRTPGGKIVLIDPWLGNPTCPEDQRQVRQVDLLLVTHGHGDHLGETVGIATDHAPVVVACNSSSPVLSMMVARCNDAGIERLPGPCPNPRMS